MDREERLPSELSLRKVISTWWPLAASWMLMGIELPALSAVVARLANPEINLAAYGGIVFPLSLIIEAPIIMLLPASTALSKDWPSYQLIRKFMIISGAIFTGLHILVAFTPLYYFIVEDIIGAPQPIVEPARIGLMIMTPWTWSIAYRRFNQGVLIRFGHSKAVGSGTIVRLVSNLLVLTFGFLHGDIPGIVVGSCAIAFGVVCEAFFIGILVHPVLKNELAIAPYIDPPLTWSVFWPFYIPLVMTSLLTLLANPIGSAALSRMPRALESLAVWPVITGVIFLLRSLGIAYNEVVVALLDTPRSFTNLRQFAFILSTATTVALLLFVATPFANFWFETLSALPPKLAIMGISALWLALPLPALSVMQSWYQGAILFGRKTRAITESVVVYLATSMVILGFGVYQNITFGLYIGILALTLSVLTQTIWLWWRSKRILRYIHHRDIGH